MNELEFWREACDDAEEAICLMSYNNKFVCCNQSWSFLFGYSEEELVNKTWMSLTKSDDLIKTYKVLQKVKEENTEYFFHKNCYTKYNHELPLDLYIRRFDDKKDNFLIIAKRRSTKEDLQSKFFDLKQKALDVKQKYLTKLCTTNQNDIAQDKLQQNINFKKDDGFNIFKKINKHTYILFCSIIFSGGIISFALLAFINNYWR